MLFTELLNFHFQFLLLKNKVYVSYLTTATSLYIILVIYKFQRNLFLIFAVIFIKLLATLRSCYFNFRQVAFIFDRTFFSWTYNRNDFISSSLVGS